MKTTILTFLTLIVLSCSSSSDDSGQSQNNNDNDNNNNNHDNTWLVPVGEIKDGGPGKDGIPSIDNPQFISRQEVSTIDGGDLVIGLVKNNEAYAYPHEVMDWHEIVNHRFSDGIVTISYCPLTGTAFGWEGNADGVSTTFGVSGLLYNANLILYDRYTESHWSQLRQDCINGTLISKEPNKLTVVETTWQIWREMYPDTKVLSRETGFERPYGTYPYGPYKTDHSYFIFEAHPQNTTLPSKKRIYAIMDNGKAKVYKFEDFTGGKAIIDNFNAKPYLVVGNEHAINAFLIGGDLSLLSFEYNSDGETFFEDSEGNKWNIFGKALEGPRIEQTLTNATGVTSFWFAIAAFYPDPDIYKP